MTIQTVATLTNSIQARYTEDYIASAMRWRLYDQIAVPYTNFSAGKSMDELMRGSSINWPFISGMAPGTTAISETADVTPQVLVDATGSITPTSRGEALQWSELSDIEAYDDLARKRSEALGQNALESIEALAISAGLAGTWVERATTRILLASATTAHNITASLFSRIDGEMQTLMVPGYQTSDGQANTWVAIMHPWVFHDLIESSGSILLAIGEYQDKGILLNWELGKLGNFRILSSAMAKVFGGAGAVHATGSSATTLNGATARLDTSLITAADCATNANAAYGKLWFIGTLETANTFYPTNELYKPVSTTTYTQTVIGSGSNRGLRYAHASGVTVNNNSHVFPVLFAGPESLIKVYASDVGEFGQILPPEKTGLLKQWTSQGWKYYGNYGRLSENRLIRVEVSASLNA